MRLMGLEAIDPKPRLSQSDEEHRKYPYLLRAVEWLWRTVKYGELDLLDYQTVSGVRKGLVRYFLFYHWEKFYESLGDRFPTEVYGKEKGLLNNLQTFQRMHLKQRSPSVKGG